MSNRVSTKFKVQREINPADRKAQIPDQPFQICEGYAQMQE